MKILIFLLISFSSFCQIHEFRTEFITNSKYDSVLAKYKEWEPWESYDVLIVYNGNSNNVEIFSQFKHIYHILEVMEFNTEEEKKNILLISTDERGNKCFVEFVYFKGINKYHLYIRWSNLQVLYQMKKL